MSDTMRGALATGPVTHDGEQAVQKRVGEGGPQRGSPMFGPVIQQGFAEFIRDQRMFVIGACDDAYDVWATVLTGATGFADPVDETTLVFDALPAPGDPLRNVFAVERDCGTVAVDTVRCRRVRANGRMRREGKRLVMRTEQVLRNCPKYIQKRALVDDADPSAMGEARSTSGTEITAAQEKWIAGSDTFFIASYSPEHGADASHRGGSPGFVTVSGPQRLTWPDYAGNSFYMTFGNLEFNPACGLLFLDWQGGNTLHLTGRARVDWDDRSAPGARRTVHFDVQRVVQVGNATTLRWRFVEASSFNP